MGTISYTRQDRLTTLPRILGVPLFAGPIFRQTAERVARLVLQWHERIRQRYQLAAMDVRMLRDIGLNRTDVAREAAKSFWQN